MVGEWEKEWGCNEGDDCGEREWRDIGAKKILWRWMRLVNS